MKCLMPLMGLIVVLFTSLANAGHGLRVWCGTNRAPEVRLLIFGIDLKTPEGSNLFTDQGDYKNLPIKLVSGHNGHPGKNGYQLTVPNSTSDHAEKTIYSFLTRNCFAKAGKESSSPFGRVQLFSKSGSGPLIPMGPEVECRCRRFHYRDQDQ